ncbi:CHAT domain-containing protein [Microbacter sp. GSS18]|nr:CHAT domain-containing protein [Microbacter sp. GSS18]
MTRGSVMTPLGEGQPHVEGAARPASALAPELADDLAGAGRVIAAALLEWIADGAAVASAPYPEDVPHGAALIVLDDGTIIAAVARRRRGSLVADVPARPRARFAVIVLVSFSTAAERDRYVCDPGAAATGALVARMLAEHAQTVGPRGAYSYSSGYAVAPEETAPEAAPVEEAPPEEVPLEEAAPEEAEAAAPEEAAPEEAAREEAAPAEEAPPEGVPRMAPRPRRPAPPFGIDAGAGPGVPRMAPPPTAAPRAEPAAEPVSAHIDAEMPGRLVQGEAIDVTVRLSPVPLQATPGAAHAEASIRIDPRRPVDLVVVPRGLAFALGHRSTHSLMLPPDGEPPAVIRVGLVPIDIGTGEVSVIVRQGPVELPLATLRLTAPIVAAEDAAPAPTLQARALVSGAAADVAGLPTLRVDESIAAGRSTLRIALVVGDERAERAVVIGDKVAFIDRIYRRLDGVRAAIEREPAENRAREAARQIADIGRVMTRALLRGDIADLLWRRRDDLDGIIVQTSGEIDLPWEIVTIDEPGAPAGGAPRFLADAGVTRWVYDTVHPETIVVRPGHVLAIAPDYEEQSFRLSRTAEELTALDEQVSVTAAVVPHREDLSGRIGGDFDLLHFAGHGRWRDDAPRRQELLLASFRDDGDTDGAYTDADARTDLSGAAPASAPLVFLSACDVGRLSSDGPGLGGFAEAFLHGGAGAFIGCGWAVRDDVASTFVRTFYRAVFAEGKTIGEATAAARSAAGGARDPSALAFAVFADPRSRLTTGGTGNRRNDDH